VVLAGADILVALRARSWILFQDSGVLREVVGEEVNDGSSPWEYNPPPSDGRAGSIGRSCHQGEADGNKNSSPDVG